MNFLEKAITEKGIVREGNILKVDSFLNHQIDVDIMRQIACELKRRFKDTTFNKVLTIEASGIAIGTMVANLCEVPVVFAKKSETANSTDDKYVSEAFSYTHRMTKKVFISKPYLNPDDRVLIVDDFLADGHAAHALIDISHQAGAEVVGIGIAIEKGYQNGGKTLRQEGYRVESVTIIDSMDTESQSVTFRPQNSLPAVDTDMDAHDYMQIAIEEARTGIKNGHGGPFGAVIVKDGKIVSQGHNMVLKNNDATAHGEMMALRKAGEVLGTFDLSGCTLYTTGEPCHMCLCAIMWANIDKVYYGCTIADNGRIGFRDDKFNDIFGGRERLGDFLVEVDRDKCLDLFDEYNNMQHANY